MEKKTKVRGIRLSERYDRYLEILAYENQMTPGEYINEQIRVHFREYLQNTARKKTAEHLILERNMKIPVEAFESVRDLLPEDQRIEISERFMEIYNVVFQALQDEHGYLEHEAEMRSVFDEE